MYRAILALLLFGCGICAKRLSPDQENIQRWRGWLELSDRRQRTGLCSHANDVDDVDPKKGEVLGKITVLHGHGIAIAAEYNRAHLSNGQSDSITALDVQTPGKIGEAIPASMNPDAIIYDHGSSRVFAFNGRNSSATAVDAKDGKVAGTVTLEAKPEFRPGDSKGQLTIEDRNQVFDIDSKKLNVDHKWPLAPCESLSGRSMDLKNRRIFSGCHNKMMGVMDADSGKFEASAGADKQKDGRRRIVPGTFGLLQFTR